MEPVFRVLRLLARMLFGLIFVFGVIETAEGAPGVIKQLEKAVITSSHTAGLILAIVITIAFGLLALGPDRVKHWLAAARGQPASSAPASTPPGPVWPPAAGSDAAQRSTSVREAASKSIADADQREEEQRDPGGKKA